MIVVISSQGLDCHILKCEKEHNIVHASNIGRFYLYLQNHPLLPDRVLRILMFAEQDVENALSLLVDKATETVNKKTNQLGANHPRSHAATFKAKVFNELLHTEK